MRTLIPKIACIALLAAAPLAASAADPYVYSFESGREGWLSASPSVFTTPIASATDSSLTLRATDNSNTFGFWFSPATTVPVDPYFKEQDQSGPDQIIFLFSRLYQATWYVWSDITTPTQVPQFRLRSYLPDFSQATIMAVESNGDGVLAPGPFIPLKEENKTAAGIAFGFYDQLIYQPFGASKMAFSFDLLNFYPSDAPNGQVALSQLSIQQTGFPSGPALQTHEWNLGEVNPGFTKNQAPPLAAPSLFRDGRGLAAQALIPLKESKSLIGIPDTYFGFWSYISNIRIQPDSIYHVAFRVGANTPEAKKNEVPVVRLRVNENSFQGTWYLNIDSTGENPYVPFQGQSVTYHLYFRSPYGLDGNKLIFSFDYLWTNNSDNDPTDQVWLEYLRVDRFADSVL